MKKTTKKVVAKTTKKTKKISKKGNKMSVGYGVLNGSTGKKMDIKSLPEDIRKVIDGIAKQFENIGVEVENMEDIDNLSTDHFVPTSKERVEEVKQEAEEICRNGKRGFMIQGLVVTDPKAPKDCVASVKGICKVNNVPTEYILLSIIQHLGISRQEAISILSDNKYEVRDNPNKW